MAVALGDLVINVVCRTGAAEQGLNRTRQSMFSLTAVGGKLISSLAGVAGAYLSVHAAISLVRRSIQQLEDFNQKAANSFAIVRDLSDEMREKMIAQAHDVAFATKHGADEAVGAYYYLASAGLDAAQSMAALPQMAKFAQAGNFDFARATELAADAQSALGMRVEDAQGNLVQLTRVTDVLTRANTLANATTEQFSEALTTKAGAALKTVGKDIEEGVAILAAWADQGVKGADAGTALNIVFRELQTKAIENADAFKANRVAVFDSSGDMRNMADIVEDLEKRLAGMSDEQKKATLMQLGFADRSIVFIQSLIGTSQKIREYEIELRRAGGTTEEVASKQIPELTKGMHQLKAAVFEVQQVQMGPTLDEWGKWLQLFAAMTKSNADTIAADLGKIKAATGTLAIAPPGSKGMMLALSEGLPRARDRLLEWFEAVRGAPDAQKQIEEAMKPIEGKARGPVSPLRAALGPELPKEMMEEQAAAIEKANEALRKLGMTAEQKALESFLEPLREAGVPMEQLTDLTSQFEQAMRDAGAAIENIASPLKEARDRARDLLASWKEEAGMFGLEDRERAIEELAGKLDFGDADILAGLREWDRQLDELEAKTKAVEFAGDLRSQLETPMQAAKREMTEILETARRFPDALSPDLALEAITRVAEQGKRDLAGMVPEPQFAGAMERGSKEEYSARLRMSSQAERQKNLEGLNKDMKTLQQRMVIELEKLNLKYEADMDI